MRIAVRSPLPNLDKVAIQSRGIGIGADLLQTLDDVRVVCLIYLILFASPWRRASCLCQIRSNRVLLL
jgi:hypothetical protein